MDNVVKLFKSASERIRLDNRLDRLKKEIYLSILADKVFIKRVAQEFSSLNDISLSVKNVCTSYGSIIESIPDAHLKDRANDIYTVMEYLLSSNDYKNDNSGLN